MRWTPTRSRIDGHQRDIRVVVLIILVSILVATQIARAVSEYRHRAWQRSRAEEAEADPVQPARRYQQVFAPIGCGLATHHAGLTGPCVRRKTHTGRCLTEHELEQLAEIGPAVVVIPAPGGAEDFDAAKTVA